MKKFLAISLALVLTLALTVTAFAAATPVELTAGAGSATGTITVNYAAAPSNNTPVYAVDVEFGALTFTYTPAGTGAWSPEDHAYTEVEATWAASGNTVTVTNHSNAAMTATFSNTAAEGITVTYSGTGVSNKVLSLASCVAEGQTSGAAVTGTVTVDLSGAAPSTGASLTLTVAIAPAAA